MKSSARLLKLKDQPSPLVWRGDSGANSPWCSWPLWSYLRDLLDSTICSENVIKQKKTWQQCHEERGFPPQLILNRLHYVARKARFFNAKGLRCWNRRAQRSAWGWWALCSDERGTVFRAWQLLGTARLHAAYCSSEGHGKPLHTALSCQGKNFSIQVLKTKWNSSTAVMSGDALRQARDWNCAEARNPAVLGWMMNYKYKTHWLRFESFW